MMRFVLFAVTIAVAAVQAVTLDGVDASRVLVWEGVDNARDLGGLTTVDGRTVKRGMIFRSQAFNDNAISDWLGGNDMFMAKSGQDRLVRKVVNGEIFSEFGRKNAEELLARIDRNDLTASCMRVAADLRASKVNWRKGTLRGTEASRRRILRETGLKTEIDLRTASECWGMEGSPLGPEVKWINIPAANIVQLATPIGREAFTRCFRLFLDERNYPIDFHCIAGADRTGALAFLIEAALGVREEEIERDYVLTSLFNITPRPAGKFRRMTDEMFSSYPGKTLSEKAIAYIKTCGFTDEDLTHLRALLLEEAKQKPSK